MNFRDVELLSTYLDGRLSPSDSARLEKRLASDRGLKAQLEELRQTQGILRRLPQRRAPRNFRLTAKMAGIRPPEPRAYPVFRLATALATFLFVAAVALNGLAPIAASHLTAAAPVPAFGMGGGGGGSGQDFTEAAPAATEAPAPLAPLAAAVPTATAQIAEATAGPNVQTEDASRNLAQATEDAFKAAPVEPPAAATEANPPVPVPWVVALGVIVIISAAAAWQIRSSNERRIRDRWKEK